MKALIALKDFDKYQEDDIFMMSESTAKLELYKQPRPDKLMLMDVPAEYDKETWDMVHTLPADEKWVKEGEEDLPYQPTRIYWQKDYDKVYTMPMITFWQKDYEKTYTMPTITYWEKDGQKVYEEPADLTGWVQGEEQDLTYLEGEEQDDTYVEKIEDDPTWTYVPEVFESWNFVQDQAKVNAKEAKVLADQKESERKSKSDLGRRSRQLSDEILDYIAGHNMQLNVTAEDIDVLQQTFGTIEALLKANRPFSARPMIQAIDHLTNDFVTVQMKDDIEAIYQDSGLIQE